MFQVLQIPEFRLATGHPYTEFVCSSPGAFKVGLKDGREYELDFQAGWHTDVTSTPRLLLSFLPQLGPHSPASLAHDRALEWWRKGKVSLKTARLIGMEVLSHLDKVGWFSRWSWIAGVYFMDFVIRPFERKG